MYTYFASFNFSQYIHTFNLSFSLRDILPFPLKLPQVIQKVAKYEDMEVISSLGSGKTYQ